MANEFTVGAAQVDITPDRDMIDQELNGHLRPDERGSRLLAKALVMTWQRQRSVLIAVDNCGFETANAVQLCRAVAEATGIPTENIIISASHTHSAPLLEPLSGPHPYRDFLYGKIAAVAREAQQSCRCARIGHGVTHVAGASFNQRVPLAEGGVKFTRDFREGLATGRPVDPRLNVVRIDDEQGSPIAGWVRFAAHPACVIFNAPISAEYPGYMTEELSQSVSDGAPILFGYGASGDVNCIPMFGTEDDSAKLGHQLAQQVAEVFSRIETRAPRRFTGGTKVMNLPLDASISLETLDREIEEIHSFIEGLDRQPDLEWVIGYNCRKEWTVAQKKNLVQPLADWAERTRRDIQAGRVFPRHWPVEVIALRLDDLALLFVACEPFTELGLAVAARSPLQETLLVSLSNGGEGYIVTAEEHRRGGYEAYHNVRYIRPDKNARPLPYAAKAGECLISDCLALIEEI